MNRSCYLLLLIIGTFYFGNSATAQATGSYQINGVIADTASHQPLAAATIRLQNDSGRNLATVATDSLGQFHFSVSPLKQFTIHITLVGYEPKVVRIEATDGTADDNNIDSLFLKPINKTLNNVTITASKPLIKQEADRIIYDLQADPDSKSNSVWEMMRKVPFLSIDGQENILLKGSSSYRIFINGKPSGMVERNPKEVLRSIPASTIVSIEVITTPSAKYDAEGLAGIINIITTKKLDNGYTGNINLNAKLPAGGPGAGSYFAFKNGKFGMSVLGGGSLYNTPEINSTVNRKTTDVTRSNLDQYNTNTSNSRNAYVGTEWSYEIDSLQLISAQFNLSKSNGDGFAQQASTLTANNSTVQQYTIANDNNSNGTGLDLGLNYQLGFKKNKSRLLTFSYRYLANSNQQNAALNIDNRFNYPYADFQQDNNGRTYENTFQADYVQSVKKWIMETGIKAILRNNSSDYRYAVYDTASGIFLPDALRSNNYQNQQQILSVYNVWQVVLKSWSVKAGLRLEQTNIDADFISTTSGVQQHYISVIPAAVIGKKWNNRSSISFSYTRRIQRPGINQLNPFIDRSNPNFLSSGNPELKPSYTDVLQLSYTQSKKATINVAVGCMLMNDLVSRFAVYDDATGITLTTFRNIGATRIYKTNVYFNYPVTKNWNLRLNSDIRYIQAEFYTNKGLIENKQWSAYVNLATGYQWSKGWRINTDLTLNSRTSTGLQSFTNGFVLWNCNLQKTLLKDKLTLAATIQNPFAKYRYNRENYFGPDFTQVTNSQLYYRSFGISINYRFGKLKDAVKKSKRGIKNDDGSE
jgi:hypothetical protein